MAQLRPKIVKLAKIIGGVTGITTKIDENANTTAWRAS